MFLDVLYLQKYICIYLASSQTFLSYPSVNESSRRWRRGKVWKKTVARDCTILFDLCSQPNETRILQIAFRHPPLPLHLLEIWEIFVPTPNTLYSFHSIPSSSKLSIMSNRPTILPIEKSSKNSRRDEDIISFNRAIESDRWDADFLKERIAYVFQIRIKSLARSLKFLSPG